VPPPPGEEALRAWWDLRIGEAWAGAGRPAEELAAYEAALAQAQAPAIRVAVLEALAGAQERRRDLERAAEIFRQALALREETWPASLELARGLHQLGNVLWGEGKLDEAESLYGRSLALRAQLAPASLEVAASLTNLGVMAYYRGELDRPAEYYRRALEIRQRLTPGGFQVAVSLNNLGLVHYARGELATAEQYYGRVLRLWDQPAPERRELLASVLNNLGNLAFDRGDLERAEDLQRQALAIWQEIAPEGRAIAECVDNLGLVLRARGDFERAQDFLEQSLALRRKLGNPTFIASSLVNLGALAKGRGDLARAEEYLSRALAEGALPERSMAQASLLGDLGLVALDRGDLDRAEQLLRRTLALHEELAPGSLHAAQTLTHLARLARARGQDDGAAELLLQAIELEERLAPQGRDHAETLRERAALAAARAEPEAPLWYERAVAALEGHLGRLGGSHDVKAGFRASFADLYRGFLELLLARGEPGRAFHVLERSRAQGFLALLAERDLVFAADLPPELESERRRLAALYDRAQARLASAEGEEAPELAAELRRLLAEHQALLAKIRAASPRFAALRYPEPLDAAGARAALEPGTALLAYSLGGETSHLFVLTRSRGLSELELPVGREELRREVEGFRALVQDVRPGSPRRRALAAGGRRLYELLLAPAEEIVAPEARLLIVPEGPLHLLPWAALRRPGEEGPSSEPAAETHLVDWKPIHLALSATVYAEVTKTRPAAAPSDAAPTTVGAGGEAEGTHLFRVGVFGDPRYGAPAEPARPTASAGRPGEGAKAGVPAGGGRPPEVGGDPARGAAAGRGCRLEPLPATRGEAAEVGRLWGDGARVFLGEEATEERVKVVAPEVEVLHLAAHGCLDERFPLNSALALTLPGEPAEGHDNGLLQAWEIFEGMRLDADLVVLSACDSALGKELAGEGLLGLTRAFQYAGARSVVASLWQVPDQATAELMVRFHRHLREGLAKAEALRAAQAELASGAAGTEAQAPYFWAGFQVFGDWW
jgi:CHAT domain-containing protein/Tfp pilus assembly protein PilF